MCFRGETMAEVLMFNIEKSKAAKIKMLCRKFFVEATEVSKEDFGCKISYLLGLSENREGSVNSDFSEEMLYFADINGGVLSILLDQLRRKKTPVALKAVKTDVNVNFTPYELYREISAEREAITRGESAH